MKPGDIVEIFTGDIHEGPAELIKLIEDYGNAEYWLVKFPDDYVRPRLIMK